jgi:glycosyltransferase involved in cell wall biosynthesis
MKIKIAHVQVLPILSGVQNISLEIFSGLSNDKYDKYLICSLDEIESEVFKDKFEKAGVTIIRLANLKRNIGLHDVKVCIELYRLFKHYQFDVVHTHSTKPGIVARTMARIAGVRAVIHTVHGVAFHKNERLLKRLVFYILEFTATLFGHYITSVNCYYQRYYKFVRSRYFRVIHNGVDIDVELIAKNIGDEGKVKNILFLSRLDKAKDPITLLQAISLLVNKYQRQDFRLLIAGEGEYMAEAQHYVLENHLDKYVDFLGWIEDKHKIYAQADIFCVPSIFEAFGLVFAEAGLHQLPTVATTVEGIPEVVIDGETGILVEPKNCVALAEKLNFLLDNPAERVRLGKNAKSHVIRHFSRKRMVADYKKLYSEALLK